MVARKMATEIGRMMILVGLLCDFCSMSTVMESKVMANLCGERHELWEPVILMIEFGMTTPLKNCGVHLRAFPNQRLMITIKSQYIVTQSARSSCNRFLTIRDGRYNDSESFSGDICGDTQFRKSDDGYLHSSKHGATLITTSDNVFFSFHVTVDVTMFESSILISPFHEGQCSSTEYQCTNNRCVNKYVHCNFLYNLCGDKMSRVHDGCDTQHGDNMAFLIVAVVMGFALIIVIAAMCCCCYRCRQKRHRRRRRRRARQERRTLRALSIPESVEGIGNPGLQISPEVQLPAYLPSYPPPEYTTLPRSHGPPQGIADKPPDAQGPEADPPPSDPPPSYDDVHNHTPPVICDTSL